MQRDDPAFPLAEFTMTTLEIAIQLAERTRGADWLGVHFGGVTRGLIPMPPPSKPEVDPTPRLKMVLDHLKDAKGRIQFLVYAFLTVAPKAFDITESDIEMNDLERLQQIVDQKHEALRCNPIGPEAMEVDDNRLMMACAVSREGQALFFSKPYRVVPQVDGESRLEFCGELNMTRYDRDFENPSLMAMVEFLGS